MTSKIKFYYSHGTRTARLNQIQVQFQFVWSEHNHTLKQNTLEIKATIMISSITIPAVHMKLRSTGPSRGGDKAFSGTALFGGVSLRNIFTRLKCLTAELIIWTEPTSVITCQLFCYDSSTNLFSWWMVVFSILQHAPHPYRASFFIPVTQCAVVNNRAIKLHGINTGIIMSQYSAVSWLCDTSRPLRYWNVGTHDTYRGIAQLYNGQHYSPMSLPLL